ncbi:hypothetical protein DFAR_1350004 [Desulfarculales bacterium]
MYLQNYGYPRSLILKNGEEVWLRPLESQQDEERLLDFFARVPDDDRWYLENDVSDAQIVRHHLLCYHPARMLPIVAPDEMERIVGKATLNRYPNPEARSLIGHIRVVVTSSFGASAGAPTCSWT